MKIRRIGFIAAHFVLPGLMAAQQVFDISKVGDGVYAAMRRPTAPMVVGSNAAVIVDEEGVIVVDTHYTPSAARALLAEIKKITDKPVRYVINSHWHNDHVQGNQAYVNVFPGGVEFISSHVTREDMEHRAIPAIRDELNSLPTELARREELLASGRTAEGQPLTEEQKQARRADLGRQRAYLAELQQLQLALPTITFERSLVLHRKNRDIHIVCFGRGHTRGDVVVYLPKERIVVTGDLVTGVGSWPFPRDSYPGDWAKTLRSIAALDFTRLIPGHGQVHRDKAHVELLAQYFSSVSEQVQSGIQRGLTLEQIQESIDVRELREKLTGGDAQEIRSFNYDLKIIVARAHAEARDGND